MMQVNMADAEAVEAEVLLLVPVVVDLVALDATNVQGAESLPVHSATEKVGNIYTNK